MRYTFVIFLVLLFASCKSVDKYNQQVTSLHSIESLKADVDAVYKQLQKHHPHLYQYTSKEVLDFKFDSLKTTIMKPITSQEFYEKIAPVIKEVRQGHISVVPPKEKFTKKERKALQKKEFEFYKLDFEYLDNTLWVEGARKDSTLIGSQVLKIGNEDPNDLIKKYKTQIASDGYNTTLYDRAMSKGFTRMYYRDKGFLDSLPMTFKLKDSVFTKVLRLVDKNKKTDSINKPKDTTVAAELSKAEKRVKKLAAKEKRRQNKKLGYIPSRKEYTRNFSFLDSDNEVAYMKIRSFTNGKFKTYYDESFEKLDSLKTPYLVIDLRDNGGGRISEIAYLYAYLAQDDFQFINESEVNSRVPFMAFAMANGSPFGLKVVSVLLSPLIVTHNLLKTKKVDDKIYYKFKYSKLKEPKENNYQGKVYVLINGNSFSASSILSTNLQATNRAVFVGEETGGAYNGTVAGIYKYYTLPNSLIKVRIGLMHIDAPYKTKPDGYGVRPDVFIVPTQQDRINDVDPELDWILMDIEKDKSYSGSGKAH
ncbi:S41 family peptidase [Hanstruepera ponticola]|uniref:S41 family peptidase n=1 Tax=Hanstruepera ponticola TaxID=2042995 RepID=UPI000CF19357|nr:S41 family peptidase [Hanstruepera ponticola]